MNTSKEQKIVEYLRSKYNPVGILLHGSRAVGKERTHSDWDIIMIFERDLPKKGHREEVEGEDVEWKAFVIPVPDEHLLDTFDVYLQYAKVLWEKDSGATDLLAAATRMYAAGPNLTQELKERERQFFRHKIDGMIDDRDVPYMFQRHLSVIFNRASNMWFEILQNQFAKPYYISIPIIEEKDPQYHDQLMILCSDCGRDEKIVAAESIFQKLFK